MEMGEDNENNGERSERLYVLKSWQRKTRIVVIRVLMDNYPVKRKAALQMLAHICDALLDQLGVICC